MNIRIEYLLTKKEFLEAFDGWQRTTKLFYVDWVLSVLAAVAGVFLVVEYGLTDTASLVLGIVVFAASLTTLIPSWRVSRLITGLRFAQNPKSRQVQTLVFGDTGFDYQVEGIRSTIGWEYYSRAVQTANTLVLISGAQQFSAIPKRAFAPGDLEELTRFLAVRYPTR